MPVYKVFFKCGSFAVYNDGKQAYLHKVYDCPACKRKGKELECSEDYRIAVDFQAKNIIKNRI